MPDSPSLLGPLTPSRLASLLMRRSSPHEGSKPGHKHLTDTAQDEARRAQRAQAWSKATGRPLPPQLRARTTPVRRATRRPSSWRLETYRGPLSAAQFRRLTRKAKMTSGQRAAQRTQLDMAAAPEPGPRAPRSPGARARFRRNAAQQARHLARRAE